MRTPAEFNVFTCPIEGINLVEASAGTGKTWNICGLYLRLLLERRLGVQQILVVTFTNAATAELRERIRSRIVETLGYLEGRASAGADPFVPRLVSTLEERRGILRDDMAKALDLALQTFDEGAIFTIHGFCQRALADTPFTAGLPFSLELVQDDSELLMEAVHDFWRSHLAGDSLTPELAAYLLRRKDSPGKYAALLRRHLAKPLANCLWPQDIDRPTAMDTEALSNAYAAARTTWRACGDEIQAMLMAALPGLNANSYKPDFVRRAAADWDAFFRAGEPLAPLESKDSKLDLFRASTLAKRSRKDQATPTHAFFDQAEALLAARVAVEGALELARLRLIRALLSEAENTLRGRKRAQRVVSFDDLLHNVFAALASGDYPWLAPSLRARFPAALIDEFQDTDPLQFSIFDAIYGTGEAPFFLVGDPKQAIYSFRNADLHTYLDARKRASAQYTLAENQRSTGEFIAALNGLFGANGQAFMLPGLDYHEVRQGEKRGKPFRDASEARSALQVWMLPQDGTGDAIERKEARRAAVRATAAEIARLMSEAKLGRISLDGRPLRPGDIAVLVRSHAQGSEIKQALASLAIGSVELSQASVFHTADAEEVERVLTAIMEPARDTLLRAALATELIGCDAGEIVAICADEARLMAHMERFAGYRDTWLHRGVGFMYRQLLSAEGVSARMLARPDGERRLTNLLHLGERLHQAAETHHSADAMLRWLQTQRREATADEAAQLRLESDQNLVQIVTIHKAKGLEYPIVFCPFLWDGRSAFGGVKPEGREYHDADNRAVIDFRTDGDDAEIKRQIRLEESAEFLRLIYVALTRAIYRCYLVAGCYVTKSFGNSSASESTKSLLNWMVAGNGQAPQAWFAGRPTPADIDTAWQELARKCHPHITLAPLPAGPGTPVSLDRPAPDALAVLPAPARIPDGWRISSFSGLSHGAVGEHAASDHDARVRDATGSLGSLPAGIELDDILRFPRGPAAGDCLHAVFERIDFTDPAGWDAAIAQALFAHPQSLPGLPQAEQQKRLARMLRRLIEDVTRSELPDGITLGSIPLGRRLTELEFSLPSPRLSAGALNPALKALGYPVPRLSFGSLEGYLKGFIDLVFEHAGRYYVLDWKSNHLGYTAADYAPDALAEAMREHGYHLQHLLYSVALKRYLARRIPGYRHDSHFGGVLYLFVRGLRPAWKTADGQATGVYFHRPASGTLLQLDALLDPQPAAFAP